MQILSLPNPDWRLESLAKRLHADVTIVKPLLETIDGAVRSQAAFRTCYPTDKGKEAVVIDRIQFCSRVLADNLSAVGRVFPFVLTLGTLVDALIDETDDILDKYLLDEMANIALRDSREKLERHLLNQFALKSISCMTPGSLEDWPIEEQKKLFALIEGIELAISVNLTDSYLMIPRKSVSGIYFSSEVNFISCQLCPRARCDVRKAPFDESKIRAYEIEDTIRTS